MNNEQLNTNANIKTNANYTKDTNAKKDKSINTRITAKRKINKVNGGEKNLRKFTGGAIFKLSFCVVLGAYCLSLIIPLAWMIYSSFKSEIDYTLSPFKLPKTWEFSNYSAVFNSLSIRVFKGNIFRMVGVGEMFLNSVAYAFIGTAVNIFFTAAVAYVMGRYRFIGNKFIYNFGILLMLVPIMGSLPAGVMLKKSLGLYDNLYPNLFIPPSTPFSGLTFLILHATFRGIPQDFSEAGTIDGAGPYRIMFRLIFPMAFPTMLMFFVFSVLGMWNDYESFIIWYPSYPNLAYGLYTFRIQSTAGSGGATMPQILAGFTLVMIPTAIMYLSTQNLILSKFTVGGLKA